MPTEYFLPDEDDARVLRVLIDREKKRIQGKGVPYEQDHVPTAPEVYIALIPEGGIEGVEITPGTGTGTGSGTGSGMAPGDGDLVNSAFCNIYEIRNVRLGLSPEAGFSTEKELVYCGFAEEVHNLSTTAISAGYAPISRDKFGRFVTSPGGGSQRHKAVITQLGGILPEEQGEVQIWQGRPPAAVDGWFEQAWLDWLYVDEGLPEGQRVIIDKYAGDAFYTIELPWC